MAIVQATIKAQIDVLIGQTKDLPPAESQDIFSEGLANIVVAALASAQVVIPSGVIIVTGSAVTQTNPAPVFGTLQ